MNAHTHGSRKTADQPDFAVRQMVFLPPAADVAPLLARVGKHGSFDLFLSVSTVAFARVCAFSGNRPRETAAEMQHVQTRLYGFHAVEWSQRNV